VKTLSRPSVALSLAVIVIVLLAAFFPSLFTSRSPLDVSIYDKLQPPSSAHWFGTDYLGRDVYARVVYGTSHTLTSTVVAVLIAFCAGSFIGLVAGYWGGLAEVLLMRLVEILQSVPQLLLAIAIVAALGDGSTNVAIGVGIASVASFARLTRSEVLRVKTSVYVEASAALGLSRTGVLSRHIFPNAIGASVVMAALEFGSAVVAVSALSFLGYGEQPPTPDWGGIVADGRDYLATAWWPVVLPSVVISIVAFAATRLARAYDDHGSGALW
jgi:peptide/nickel transport system permease protein